MLKRKHAAAHPYRLGTCATAILHYKVLRNVSVVASGAI